MIVVTKKLKKQDSIKATLISLGICNEDSIFPYYHRVRDRDDISVLKCRKSGVLFLSRSDKDRETAKLSKYEDDSRRAREFKEEIRTQRWLDFGMGIGGILDILRPIAKETYAVEPRNSALRILKKEGYRAYAHLHECPEKDFDVITVFHVLEHLFNPLQELHLIYSKLRVSGKVIIEVPHANDFLLKTAGLEKFKAFTFWSEHLILHTRESLYTFLQVSGFKNIKIQGYQRFSFANHLYWLFRGKPGGHKEWSFLNNALFSVPYECCLKTINQTDTLIAIAEK